jgi:hypothetical protein
MSCTMCRMNFLSNILTWLILPGPLRIKLFAYILLWDKECVLQLGRSKNRTPARFEYIYCTLFPLCDSNYDMYPFLKDASFFPCFCFVHTIKQFYDTKSIIIQLMTLRSLQQCCSVRDYFQKYKFLPVTDTGARGTDHPPFFLTFCLQIYFQ